ncbi:mucin-1-like [Neocloeon triangulifer]|uniref:mucin-1-like n=1 Tax=Neocloeon triangulifer TaxID=2078957 RepID=UPI00286F5C95|nr:mucin-1-like [Neocloeon triangulifer]
MLNQRSIALAQLALIFGVFVMYMQCAPTKKSSKNVAKYAIKISQKGIGQVKKLAHLRRNQIIKCCGKHPCIPTGTKSNSSIGRTTVQNLNNPTRAGGGAIQTDTTPESLTSDASGGGDTNAPGSGGSPTDAPTDAPVAAGGGGAAAAPTDSPASGAPDTSCSAEPPTMPPGMKIPPGVPLPTPFPMPPEMLAGLTVPPGMTWPPGMGPTCPPAGSGGAGGNVQPAQPVTDTQAPAGGGGAQPPLAGDTPAPSGGGGSTSDPSQSCFAEPPTIPPGVPIPAGVTAPGGIPIPPGMTFPPGGTWPPGMGPTCPPAGGVTAAPSNGGATTPMPAAAPTNAPCVPATVGPGMTFPPGFTYAPGIPIPDGMTMPPDMTFPPGMGPTCPPQ